MSLQDAAPPPLQAQVAPSLGTGSSAPSIMGDGPRPRLPGLRDPDPVDGGSRQRGPCSCPTGGRNLVVCIDGTSNQFSEKNTNVVEFYSRLVKDKDQLTFYNSGIGTYATPSWKSLGYYTQQITNKLDLAFAIRFEKIIIGAYAWLADNYQPEDRIFLFGFSRGAYQVRALSAMIHLLGLIHKGNADQIPFAYELYAAGSAPQDPAADAQQAEQTTAPATRSSPPLSPEAHPGAEEHDHGQHAGPVANASSQSQSATAPVNQSLRSRVFASRFRARLSAILQTTISSRLPRTMKEDVGKMQGRFKNAFSRNVAVHFVGAWDTVSSVGIARKKTLPGTTNGMTHTCFFRHALAIHEYRVKFLPEYVHGGSGHHPSGPVSPPTKVVTLDGGTGPDQTGSAGPVAGVPHAPQQTSIAGAGHEEDSTTSVDPAAPATNAPVITIISNDGGGGERSYPSAGAASASPHGALPGTQAKPTLGPAPSPHPHTKEVWFSGCHSDIGGGSMKNANMDTFRPALRWMSFEARVAGVRLTQEPDIRDAQATRTRSLKGVWKILEIIPFQRLSYLSKDGTTHRPHLGSKRIAQKDQLVAWEVKDSVKKKFNLEQLAVEEDPYTDAHTFLNRLKSIPITSGQHLSHDQVADLRESLRSLLHSVGGQQSLRGVDSAIVSKLLDLRAAAKPLGRKDEFLSLIDSALYGLTFSFDHNDINDRSQAVQDFLAAMGERAQCFPDELSMGERDMLTVLTRLGSGRAALRKQASSVVDTMINILRERLVATTVQEAAETILGLEGIACSFDAQEKLIDRGGRNPIAVAHALLQCLPACIRNRRLPSTKETQMLTVLRGFDVYPNGHDFHRLDDRIVTQLLELLGLFMELCGGDFPQKNINSVLDDIRYVLDRLASAIPDEPRLKYVHKIFNPDTLDIGWTVPELRGFRAAVTSVTFLRASEASSSADRVLAVSYGVARICNIHTGHIDRLPAPAAADSILGWLSRRLINLHFAASLTVEGAVTLLNLVWKPKEENPLCVAFSPRGQRVAAGLRSGAIQLLDTLVAPEAEPWGLLKQHNDTIVAVAFSPKSDDFLASGGFDKQVVLWDLSSTTAMSTVLGTHRDWVRSVAFSPSGDTLCSGSDDGTVRIWNVTSHQCTRIINAHGSYVLAVTFSPTGSHILSSESSDDTAVHVWDALTGRLIGKCWGHKGGVYCIAVSPDGTRIASGSDDGTVRIWNRIAISDKDDSDSFSGTSNIE